MINPKVSVLLPVYNHAKYLRETIESVLNQTFSDFELLISDDCSTDDSVQVIKSYTDERIRGAFFEENKGTVRALNHLLKMAQGEYIAVLGSDDVWELDKLEKQLAVLENDRGLAACFSGATIIDQDSKEILDQSIFSKETFELENVDKAFLLRKLYMTGNRFCHSSALIRSSVHRQIGEYNVAYRQLHDYDLWIRILLQYNVYIIDTPLVQYRFVQNAGNVSQNTEKNNLRLYNEAEEIINFLFENISDADFLKGFAEEFVGDNIKTTAQILCEKFFILTKYKLWTANNTSLALRFLLTHLDEEMLACFEQNYGISLNKIYDYTCEYKAIYNAEIYGELRKLQADYSELVSQKQILEEQCQYQEEQCKYHEEQNIILHKTIQEIYSSNSWKITKPLRVLTGMMKKS